MINILFWVTFSHKIKVFFFFSFLKPSKGIHYNDGKVVYTTKQDCQGLLVPESSRCCLKTAIFLHFVFQQLVYCYIIQPSSKGKCWGKKTTRTKRNKTKTKKTKQNKTRKKYPFFHFMTNFKLL